MYDLYSQSDDNSQRFVLGRAGKRMLFVIGLNPSTATQEKSDTTVAKVEHVAEISGYSGFAMLNLYPVRATDYNTLPEQALAGAIERNAKEIAVALGEEPMPTIWAAWGNPIAARRFFPQSARLLAQQLKTTNAKWMHFGELTACGHPRHPSRLAYSWTFSGFDIHSYVSSINA